MNGSLFDPVPEDARQAAKREGTASRENKSTRITPYAPARRGAPETSHLAARLAKTRAPAQSARLLQLLAERGEAGATNEEVSDALGFLIQSQTARCRGLVLDGFVRNSGVRRPTSSGCPAIVWVLTAAGQSLTKGRAAP